MIVSLTTVRYKKWQTPFALLAMAIHRLPLSLQKGCSFWKLLGTGKDKHFTLNPDWQQWGILAVWDDRASFDQFYNQSAIAFWWNFFLVERWTILCEPLQSHGKWGGKEPFGSAAIKDYDGPIVVLTRANIRYSKLKQFWLSVKNVEDQLYRAKGYIMSVAIGETFSLAATFSVWESMEDMKAFSYAGGEHTDVIKRARNEDWMSEELFARFKPIESFGTINGQNPLKDLFNKQ
jgi:heme-degrading monooxygenase HmoA